MTFLLHLRRNISRNGGRSLGVILVVALALGIFLVLGQVSMSIVAYSNQVVDSVPNIIVVQPAGGNIGAGSNLIIKPGSVGYATLTPSVISAISSTPNVQAVQRVSISTPSLGGAPGAPGTSSCSNGNSVLLEDTTEPAKLFGPSQVSGAANIAITSGRTFTAGDENSSNILIGQQYSTDNHLYADDLMTMFGHTFRVLGVFAGSGCDGDTVIVPYPVGSALLNVSAPIFLYAYVNSYGNMGLVYSSLQSSLGSSYSVEDLSIADHNALQNAISSILLSSQFGEFAALAAGAAVIIVVMMLVTSRRTREIGILKALGYGNGRILGQILLESLILSLVGLPLALGFILVFGPLIAQSMLGQVGTSQNASPPPGANASTVSGGSNPFLQNVHFALTPETILIGVVITVCFGVLGAFYPAIRAVLLRPADALRRE